VKHCEEGSSGVARLAPSSHFQQDTAATKLHELPALGDRGDWPLPAVMSLPALTKLMYWLHPTLLYFAKGHLA
jgi:hypothetical protein